MPPSTQVIRGVPMPLDMSLKQYHYILFTPHVLVPGIGTSHHPCLLCPDVPSPPTTDPIDWR